MEDVTTTRHQEEMIAIHMFGWRWMSFIGLPTPSTSGYPEMMRVQQLLSGDALKTTEWQEFLQKHDGQDAVGNEPLAYNYCSVGCNPADVPRYFSDANADITVLERASELWPEESDDWHLFCCNLPALLKYKRGDCARAALRVLHWQKVRQRMGIKSS